MQDSEEKIQFDVLVSDPIRVDLEIFSVWVGELSEKEIFEKRCALNVSKDNIRSEFEDQFRNFALLERYFQNPLSYSFICEIQIEKDQFLKLVEKYYYINKKIMRELVGKKLGKKLRRDLDDISEKLNISIETCYRQFDNFKRIYSSVIGAVKDKKKEISSVELITRQFLVSPELAKKYVSYIFLCYHRIETTDKRLRFLESSHFEVFASYLIEYWVSDDPLKVDLDMKLKEDVIDCRTHLLSEKQFLDEYKSLVIEQLKKKKFNEKILGEISSRFLAMMKALLNIGAGISKSKEFEDFFEDLEEQIADPFYRMGLDQSQVEEFFNALDFQFPSLVAEYLKLNRHRERIKTSWHRYLQGIRSCLSIMYPTMVSSK